MKRTFLFLFFLLVTLVLAVSCGGGADSTVEGSPFVTAGTTPVSGSVAAPVTTVPMTTEADTTFEDIFYDLSPIEGEVGEPLALHWNPYLFSPILSSDSELRAGAEALVKAIVNRRLTVTFSSLRVMEAVVDNIFYEFPPSALCTFTADKESLTVRISYSLDRKEHLSAMAAFGDRVESLIADTLCFGDNEAEKALLLYHKVDEVVDYFTVAYAPWQTNGYYALMGGSGICYGFADAYNYLLRQVGMEAYLVKGYSGANLAAHGWSLVKIDGKYYHCDPTWEDSMFEGAGFRYFGNTDERRETLIVLSAATVGEGSLKAPVPYQATDSRFASFWKVSMIKPDWQIDREKQVIIYSGKQYSYAAS